MKLSSAAAAAVGDSFFSWGRLDVPKSYFLFMRFEWFFEPVGAFGSLFPISNVFFSPSTGKSRRDLRRTDDDAIQDWFLSCNIKPFFGCDVGWWSRISFSVGPIER